MMKRLLLFLFLISVGVASIGADCYGNTAFIATSEHACCAGVSEPICCTIDLPSAGAPLEGVTVAIPVYVATSHIIASISPLPQISRSNYIKKQRAFSCSTFPTVRLNC